MNRKDIDNLYKAIDLITKYKRRQEKKLTRLSKSGNYKQFKRVGRQLNLCDKSILAIDSVISRDYENR